MADEIQLQFLVPASPRQAMEDFRSSPPEALDEDGYELTDEAYDSLVFSARYYDWPQKLLFVMTLGFALLFKGFMGSVFRLTVRFDEEGPSHTKVTFLGSAHPRTRRRLAELAAEHGGPTGLRIGV